MQVAVYGTLKRGYHNNRTLGETARYIGSCWVDNFAIKDEGGFPSAFRFPQNAVWVEVWDIDDEHLKRCDNLEGVVSGWYQRDEINTKFGHCFMYTRAGTPITTADMWFPSGIWEGSNSYKVQWKGWEQEIEFLRQAIERRHSRLSDTRMQRTAIHLTPQKKASGRMVKVWDPVKDSWNYVPEDTIKDPERKLPIVVSEPAKKNPLAGARKAIDETAKEGDIPEVQTA